jgi:hypothetical protein
MVTIEGFLRLQESFFYLDITDKVVSCISKDQISKLAECLQVKCSPLIGPTQDYKITWSGCWELVKGAAEFGGLNEW